MLALLDELGSPATVATAGPRYFGFVIGGSLPATVAANWLASAWDQTAGLFATSPTGAVLEEVALRWLAGAARPAGGSRRRLRHRRHHGQLHALAAARHAVFGARAGTSRPTGSSARPPITVVVGEEAHPSLIKALGLARLRAAARPTVPVDGQGRMRADALPPLSARRSSACRPATSTRARSIPGAVIAHARERGAWVHVDGAFGLWAAASPAPRPSWRASRDADSWATDAHKWLNVPYDSGLAFVREPGTCARRWR